LSASDKNFQSGTHLTGVSLIFSSFSTIRVTTMARFVFRNRLKGMPIQDAPRMV
jgi:hypothetical protein